MTVPPEVSLTDDALVGVADDQKDLNPFLSHQALASGMRARGSLCSCMQQTVALLESNHDLIEDQDVPLQVTKAGLEGSGLDDLQSLPTMSCLYKVSLGWKISHHEKPLFGTP